LFTLFLGLLSVYFWDKSPNKFIALIVVASASALANVLNCDYGYFGVLLIFVIYLCKNNKLLLLGAFFVLSIIEYLGRLIKFNFHYIVFSFILYTFASIIPILLYNRKAG